MLWLILCKCLWGQKVLGNQELNLAADVWAQSASLIFPWLGWVLQIQQVKQKQSYFSILFGSITFIPPLFRAEQGVPSPLPPPPFFFFIFIFFCAYSPAAWAGQREGFGLGTVIYQELCPWREPCPPDWILLRLQSKWSEKQLLLKPSLLNRPKSVKRCFKSL